MLFAAMDVRLGLINARSRCRTGPAEPPAGGAHRGFATEGNEGLMVGPTSHSKQPLHLRAHFAKLLLPGRRMD